MCVSVRNFLSPRASISRNIGTYVFTAARKTLYIGIIIVNFVPTCTIPSAGDIYNVDTEQLTAPLSILRAFHESYIVHSQGQGQGA